MEGEGAGGGAAGVVGAAVPKQLRKLGWPHTIETTSERGHEQVVGVGVGAGEQSAW